jgi:hypothetical protein
MLQKFIQTFYEILNDNHNFVTIIIFYYHKNRSRTGGGRWVLKKQLKNAFNSSS